MIPQQKMHGSEIRQFETLNLLPSVLVAKEFYHCLCGQEIAEPGIVFGLLALGPKSDVGVWTFVARAGVDEAAEGEGEGFHLFGMGGLGFGLRLFWLCLWRWFWEIGRCHWWWRDLNLLHAFSFVASWKMDYVLDLRLWEQRDVILVIWFRNPKADIEMECCTGVALHDVVCDRAKEFLRREIFRFAGLGKDPEDNCGSVLRSGVWFWSAKCGKGEESELFGVWAQVVSELGFEHSSFLRDIKTS